MGASCGRGRTTVLQFTVRAAPRLGGAHGSPDEFLLSVSSVEAEKLPTTNPEAANRTVKTNVIRLVTVQPAPRLAANPTLEQTAKTPNRRERTQAVPGVSKAESDGSEEAISGLAVCVASA